MWAQLGKEIGVQYSKFQLIYSKLLENIKKIEQESRLVKEMILLTDPRDEEMQRYCSQYILHLEASFLKQTDFVMLSCIKTVLNRLRKTINTTSKRLKIKKIQKSCEDIKKLLENHINKPYSDIVLMAIQEIDNSIVVLEERFKIL